jgi:hypothetical protein
MRLNPGETEAVGWRVVTLLDAVRQLRDASPDVTGRPRAVKESAANDTAVRRVVETSSP